MFDILWPPSHHPLLHAAASPPSRRLLHAAPPRCRLYTASTPLKQANFFFICLSQLCKEFPRNQPLLAIPVLTFTHFFTLDFSIPFFFFVSLVLLGFLICIFSDFLFIFSQRCFWDSIFVVGGFRLVVLIRWFRWWVGWVFIFWS